MSNIKININNINGENISHDKKIAYISDIHGEVDKLKSTIDILKELKITALLLGGDIIDSTKDYDRNARINELLQELSETTKIFINLGNHDMLYFDNNSRNRCHAVPSLDTSFWSDLSSINNIYVSKIPRDNPTITKWGLDDEVDITAFNIPITHYINNEPEEEFKQFLKMLEGIKVNIERFNILLCHSPINIGKDNIIKEYADYLKKYNIILSGHMHGGLVPRWLRAKPYGRGLVGPYNTLFPEYSYGIKRIDNTEVITTGGITKIARSAGPEVITNNAIFRKIGDFIYPPEIELLDIKSNMNKSKVYHYK